PGPSPSRLTIDVHVGQGALLRWLPEPTIAAGGCHHRIDTRITLADGARLVWREELVLGRCGEEPGSMVSRLRIDHRSTPLFRHELATGPDHPAWASPAVGDGGRAAGSLVVVDPRWATGPPPTTVLGPQAAVVPLAGPAVQVLALADDSLVLRGLLDKGLAGLGW
ncbi:MAG: urease accessory protein UreD, partial [Acidimicrobiales bacterium]